MKSTKTTTREPAATPAPKPAAAPYPFTPPMVTQAELLAALDAFGDAYNRMLHIRIRIMGGAKIEPGELKAEVEWQNLDMGAIRQGEDPTWTRDYGALEACLSIDKRRRRAAA